MTLSASTPQTPCSNFGYFRHITTSDSFKKMKKADKTKKLKELCGDKCNLCHTKALKAK